MDAFFASHGGAVKQLRLTQTRQVDVEELGIELGLEPNELVIPPATEVLDWDPFTGLSVPLPTFHHATEEDPITVHGTPMAGRFLTEQEALGRLLPKASVDCRIGSLSYRSHRAEVTNVFKWTHHNGVPIKQAIQYFKGCADNTNKRIPTPAACIPAILDSEGSSLGAVTSGMTSLLSALVHRTGWTWKVMPRSALLHSSALAPGGSRSVRRGWQPALSAAGSIGVSQARASPGRLSTNVDIALVSQSAQHQQLQEHVHQLQQQQQLLPPPPLGDHGLSQPAVGSLCACVLELKSPAALHPVPDLVAAWRRGSRRAQSVLNQTLEYMIALNVQHAVVSCYDWTALVWRPLLDSRDPRSYELYVSDAFHQRAQDTTVYAAMGWHQQQAIECFQRRQQSIVQLAQQQQQLPSPPPPQPLQQQHQQQPEQQQRQHTQQHPECDSHRHQRQEQLQQPAPQHLQLPGQHQHPWQSGDSESHSSLDDSTDMPHQGTSSAASKALQANSKRPEVSCTAPAGADGADGGGADEDMVQLTLDRTLAEGSCGLVVRGSYDGQPAVVKLYGPDDPGMEVFWNETAVYDALRQAQGTLVPRALGNGSLDSGVHFIALEEVPGKALQCWDPVPPHVAAGAMEALRRLHAARPGFLHDDIRLENFLWVEEERPDGGGGGSEPRGRCVVIDFGFSRLDAAPEEVDEEQWRLAKLLSVQSESPRP